MLIMKGLVEEAEEGRKMRMEKGVREDEDSVLHKGETLAENKIRHRHGRGSRNPLQPWHTLCICICAAPAPMAHPVHMHVCCPCTHGTPCVHALVFPGPCLARSY